MTRPTQPGARPFARHLAASAALCACLAGSSQAQTAAPKADPQKAEQAYLAGARLLDHKDFAAAQTEFARAATLDPRRQEYLLALNLTRDQRVADLVQQAAKARMLNQPAKADTLLSQARSIDPSSELVLQHTTDSAPVLPRPEFTGDKKVEKSFAAPIELQPSTVPQDMHLRGDVRQVVTEAAAMYGIKPTFDDQVSGSNIRFDLEQTTYDQAMPILLKMNHLFAVPIDTKSVLIAKDTQENRDRLERQLEETIYIPASTTEQMNELANIVKNVFDVQKVVVSPSSGTLLIRAPAPTLKVLNYTLADLVDGGAEVVLRLQLISVDKTHTLNTGATTPTSVGAFSVAAAAQNIVSNNQTAVQALISSGGYVPTGNYAHDIIYEAAILVLSGVVSDNNFQNIVAVFGHGLTFFGVNIGGSAAYNLALNSSEARALDDVTVRIGDKQTTTLRVGSKYPITTSTYSSGVSSSLTSQLAGKTINGVSASTLLSQYLGSSASSVTPIIQFEDLGITLKTQPLVMKDGLVSLHVDLKLEALTGASANNIPVLTSRNFVSDITVADGTTAVMLSDLSSTESASISGIPGLADLPGFQESLADRMKETDSSELVLLITPHVVRHRSSTLASRRISFTPTVPVEN